MRRHLLSECESPLVFVAWASVGITAVTLVYAVLIAVLTLMKESA